MEIQIKNNNPRCEKCGLNWDKTNPLVFYYDICLCGRCLGEIMEKERNERRKKLLE